MTIALSPVRLAVLISGGGTTLLNFLEKMKTGELQAVIPVVIASRHCKGVDRARSAGLTVEVIPSKAYSSCDEYSQAIFDCCRAHDAELVVLAGFLSRILIPKEFENRVMNIHPSLIPAFAGGGMYGHHVHEAVAARGCKVSGCTVHFCDNEYDHGPIILQQAIPLRDDDDADKIAARVFEVECEIYPRAISLYQQRRLQIKGHRVFIQTDD